jgi:hypothetical protein
MDVKVACRLNYGASNPFPYSYVPMREARKPTLRRPVEYSKLYGIVVSIEKQSRVF